MVRSLADRTFQLRFYQFPNAGCPSTCAPTYADALANAPCEDRGSGPVWKNYWDKFYDHYTTAYGLKADDAALMRQAFDYNIAVNCTDAALDLWLGDQCNDLVLQSLGARSVVPLCPYTCCVVRPPFSGVVPQSCPNSCYA